MEMRLRDGDFSRLQIHRPLCGRQERSLQAQDPALPTPIRFASLPFSAVPRHSQTIGTKLQFTRGYVNSMVGLSRRE